MDAKDAIDKLLNTSLGDAECAYLIADEILLQFVRDVGYSDVAEAWELLCDKIGFLYT